MNRVQRMGSVGLALLALAAGTAPAREPDAYAAMLAYLADSRIDQRAFSGANGAIAINQAAGDLNLQANLRSIAAGARATAVVLPMQSRSHDRAGAPLHASAVIAGRALQGASGLASINQASGSGNAGINAVAATLAQQGIRETSDAMLALEDSAWAGQQPSSGPGAAAAATRRVAVDATALQGFEGVLQLNQIAGSDNVTENRLSLSVQAVP